MDTCSDIKVHMKIVASTTALDQNIAMTGATCMHSIPKSLVYPSNPVHEIRAPISIESTTVAKRTLDLSLPV
jgi:hypothetical protein